MPHSRQSTEPRRAALIIDDDPDILEIINSVLRQAGFDPVVRAVNGAVAFEYLKGQSRPFDVIVCDWMMPGMSGLDLLRQVRAFDRETPFLMLTSRATLADVQAARAAGVTGYIVKPFAAGDLRRKVEAVVNLAKP